MTMEVQTLYHSSISGRKPAFYFKEDNLSHMISIAEIAKIVGTNLDHRLKKQLDVTDFDKGQIAALAWVLGRLDYLSEILNKEP